MKSGLGKGLGKLMEGDKVAAGQPSPAEEAPVKPLTGRGVSRLVQGSVQQPVIPFPNSGEASAGAAKAATSEGQGLLIPGWFFYGADLLLLLLSVAVAIASPKPLEFGTILFCAAAIGLGGILSIIGVLRSARGGG